MATKGGCGLRCEENRKRARCNHTGGALPTACMRVYTWEVTNDLHGQDARKHADYSPIARGEKSGESTSVAGVWRDEAWRDSIETRSLRGGCCMSIR